MKSFTVAFLFVFVLALAYGQQDFKSTFDAKAASLSDALKAAADKAPAEDAEYLKNYAGSFDELVADIKRRLETPGEETYLEEYFTGLAEHIESILVQVNQQ